MPRKKKQIKTDEEIIRKIFHEEAREIFGYLGMDPHDLDSADEFRKNHAWVSSFRKLSEKVGSAVIIAAVLTLSGGILTVIYNHFKTGG